MWSLQNQDSFFKNISQSDDPDLAKYCSVKCQNSHLDDHSSDTESLFSIPAEIKTVKTDISTLTGIPIEIADCNDGEVLMKLPYSQELFQNRLEILLGEADNVKIERPDLQDIQGNLF